MTQAGRTKRSSFHRSFTVQTKGRALAIGPRTTRARELLSCNSVGAFEFGSIVGLARCRDTRLRIGGFALRERDSQQEVGWFGLDVVHV